MAYKFPGADIGRGIAGDIIQGGSLGTAATNAVNKSVKVASGSALSSAQRSIDTTVRKIESKLGVGLGRPSISSILNDPVGALKSLIGGGNGFTDLKGGWYPLLVARPDPLFQIDWVPSMPLGLPAEYVEDVEWSHPRINPSAPIFRNGSFIYTVENVETSPISITFYEDRLLTTQAWLYAWRSLQYSPDSLTFGYPSDFKLPIRIMLTDATGVACGQVAFIGCFPTNFPQVTFASEGSERVRLPVEFSVDKILFESYGAQLPGGGALQQTWEKIIQEGISDVAEGAFGRFSTSISGVTSAINKEISSAKKNVKDAFGSLSSIF